MDKTEDTPVAGPSEESKTSQKKLLIFGLDNTIFDINADNDIEAVRPHLDKLIESVIPHFDLAVWSAMCLEGLKQKLDSIGFFLKPSYKLLFYLDGDSLTPATINRIPIMVKSLQTVWNSYPQYNKHNTIIVDDLECNIVSNIDNGIQVTPYDSYYSFSDIELKLLSRYLKIVATVDDVTTLNHQAWKEYVAELEPEPESDPEQESLE